jgi:hypothetical protein
MGNDNFDYIDRSNFTPNLKKRDRDDAIDLMGASGHFKDGRAFRVECWAAYEMTFLTYYFSTKGLENLTPLEIKELLVSENVIEFDDEEYRACGYTGINVEAKVKKDASGHDMWEATVIVGDEDGSFVNDNVRMKRFV